MAIANGLSQDEILDQIALRLRAVESHFAELNGPNDDNFGNLESISAETGESMGRILAKALVLYRKGLEAEKAGQTVAILDPDLTIVEKIGGFGPEVEVAGPVPSLSR